MGADQHFDWRTAAASVLEWWHDAGVDTLADEAPRDWRAAPATLRAPATTARGPAAVAEPAAVPLPTNLDAFAAWRIGADAPEARWPGAPIAASGDPKSPIMVLVDMPERDEGEPGNLLTGPAGRLFDTMLAAIGRSRADVHLASVCTVRPVAGRITPESEARLTEIARHYVGLVAPRRLLLLGNAPSRALLGTDVARVRGGLQTINLVQGQTTLTIAAVASFHPRLLLERPADKARAWKDLQMLVAGLDA